MDEKNIEESDWGRKMVTEDKLSNNQQGLETKLVITIN